MAFFKNDLMVPPATFVFLRQRTCNSATDMRRILQFHSTGVDFDEFTLCRKAEIERNRTAILSSASGRQFSRIKRRIKAEASSIPDDFKSANYFLNLISNFGNLLNETASNDILPH